MYVNALRVGTGYAEEDNAILAIHISVPSLALPPPLSFYLSLSPSLLFSLPTLQCNDFGGRVHDCRVGSDGSSDRVSRVGEIDDDHLGRLSDLLTDTDELI